MLYRDEQIIQKVGIRADVYLEDTYNRRIDLAESYWFKDYASAEVFYKNCNDYELCREELQYVLDLNLAFSRIELFEHTEDGKTFRLKKG